MNHSRRSLVCAGLGLAAGLRSADSRAGVIQPERAGFRYSTLHLFNRVNDRRDGPALPNAPLLLASDGAFYGTSYSGGAFQAGTVFRMSSDGAISVLHDFDYWAEGARPGGLVQASNGRLYGTTSHGGASDFGIVYSVSLDGHFAVHYTFTGTGDGARSYAPLIEASDGNLYGTAAQGGKGQDGKSGGGVVFRMHLHGEPKTMHTFQHSYFQNGLVEAPDGLLYGAEPGGGSHFEGALFRMDKSGAVEQLHHFNMRNGSTPGGLILTRDGQLYGTTAFGGRFGDGVVFHLEEDRVSLLRSLRYEVEGRQPVGLLEGSDGHLYVTTRQGAKGNRGAVVRLTRDGQSRVIYTFRRLTGGCTPTSPLIEDTAGRLIGTTLESGEPHGRGTVYALTPVA